MESIKKILRTPSAFVLFLVAIVSLIGVIIKSESDKAIARIPIDATSTAEARLTEITNSSNMTQSAILLLVTRTPLPTNTDIPTSTLTAPTSSPSEPTKTLGPIRTRGADGMEMIMVPGGTFQMGSNTGDEDEKPVHNVTLDPFWTDRTEVTNAQYARCVNAGQCRPPADLRSGTRSVYFGNNEFDNYPVIYVNWNDASNYCTWAGAELPTEAQWEYAARGPEDHQYPWGNEFDATKLNYCDINCPRSESDRNGDDGFPDTAPVGSYPDGVSWVGALDMSGNVWEWVADLHGTYSSDAQVNPLGPSSGQSHERRGGGWETPGKFVGAANRGHSEKDIPEDRIGFRCAAVTP